MSGRVVFLICIMGMILLFGVAVSSMEAAQGDLVADVIIGEGADGGFGGTNDGVGVAFDGRYLYYSARFFDPVLHRVNTSVGEHRDVAVTDSISGAPVVVQAMSWDAGRSRIWAANGSRIYLVHPETGVAEFRFDTGIGCGLDDGLAYDSTDDSIWWSCDGSRTIYHYHADGTFLGSFPLAGQMVPECGFDYSSGIAVGGDILYLGADGCDFYFTFDKEGNKIGAFPYPALRSEDLECDPVTFAPIEVMWIRDAYDGHIRAFEIPPGTCGPGGEEPQPRRAVLFIQGISSQSSGDEGEGFLDRAPRWLQEASTSEEGWVKANVTISDFIYFSYSGEYRGGGTGENGETPDYEAADTCNGIDEVYVPELRRLIQSIVDKAPNTTVTILAHSMGGLITANLVATDPDIRQYIASVVTFDSPLQGRSGIEFLPGFPGPCEADSPSVLDMAPRSLVVQQASTADQLVPFYTWDATERDPIPFAPDIEFVPRESATLNSARSGFRDVAAPLPLTDNHTSIWNNRFDGSTPPLDKANLIGCAIILADDCNRLRGVDPIMPGETKLASAEVPEGSPRARFIASWNGSTVELRVTAPSGMAIDPFDLPEGASRKVGINFEAYEFTNPEPGTWILELFGADVPPEGEEVTLLLDIAGPPNQPPTADANGPYSGNEGSPVAFDGTGSSDPDGDPLTYDWDFGDGSIGTGATPTHTYADNGMYNVCLTVTDPSGASDTACTTADIANVAPTVDAGPDTENFSGDIHEVSATFSDPGVNDAPWNWTIDWGDSTSDSGSTNDQSLPITGDHQYFVPGEYTVMVCVTDKDGDTGCDSHIKEVKRVLVAINNKPGGNPNSTNLKAKHVPAALLTTVAGEYGTPRDFDATMVDISTVVWGTKENFEATGSGGTESHNKLHIEDAKELDETTMDGDPDGVAHFTLQNSGIGLDTTEACVWGKTIDGVFFVGCDSIRVVPS